VKQQVEVDGVPVDYSGLTDQCREIVRLYVEHGCDPGYGWTMILSDSLRAIIAVDAETAAHLTQIYRWLVNHAPSQAWGSPDCVRAWMRAREAEQPDDDHEPECECVCVGDIADASGCPVHERGGATC